MSIAPEPTVEVIQPEMPPEEQSEISFWDNFKIVQSHHMRALIWKNFLWMWRNSPMMLFITLLPVGECLLY